MDYEFIDEAILNDELWSCIVVILAEYNVEYEEEVDAFKSFATKSGLRSSIQVITPKDIDNKNIKTTPTPSKDKINKSRPSSSDIGTNKKLALNIKNYLLNVRSSREIKYIVKQTDEENIKEENEENLKKTKINDNKSKKTKKKENLKKKGAKLKSADSKKSAADKKDMKLHDEPKCGPNKYFILMGFYDVPLIEELIKTNVPIISVISYGKDEKFQKAEEFTSDDQSIYGNTFDTDTSAQNSTVKKITGRAAKIQQFWTDLIAFIENPVTNSLTTDLAIIPCDQPVAIKYPSQDTRINPKDKGKLLYDYISLFLYNIANDFRKYIHFINTANIVYIPVVQPLTVFQYYEKKANDIPCEYATIEYILYCMIEHVAKELNSTIRTCKNTKKNTDSEPLIINANDKIKRSTFNIKSADISKLSYNIYKQMPYNKILEKYFNEDTFKKIKLKSQLNLLYECLDNFISRENFDIILNQILFTQMYDVIVLYGKLYDEDSGEEQNEEEENKCIEENEHDEEINKEEQFENEEEETDLNLTESKFNENLFKRKRQIQLEKLKQFFNCEEFENLKKIKFEKNEILNYSIINELNEFEMLQSLQRSFLNYTSMNFQPFSGTDSVLVFFHNDYNKHGMFRNALSGVLLTTVGFRDFYAYNKNSIQSWLRNQKDLIKLFNGKWRKEFIRLKGECGELVDNKDVYPHPIKQSGLTPVQDGFTLYDIANYTVQANENLTIFYSIDGVQLKVKTMKILYSYTLITMILNSFGTKIIHHHVLDDKTNCVHDLNYFNVFMKNGTIINCKQELVEEDPIEAAREAQNKRGKRSGKKLSTISKGSEKSSKRDGKKKKVGFIEPLQATLLKYKYNFDIVLPNGLKIEIRHNREFIKQYFINSSNRADNVKNENYRIFLKNGTVIIFNNDSTIMVLYNNGTRVKLRKVIQREVIVKDEQDQKNGNNKDEGNGKRKSKDNVDVKEKKNGTKGTEDTTLKKQKSGKKNAAVAKKNEEEGAIVKTRLEYAAVDLEAYSWNGEYFMYCNNTLYDVCYRYKVRVGNNGYQFVCNKTDGATSLFTDTNLKMLHPDGTLIITKIVDDPPEQNYYNPDSIKEANRLNNDKLFRIKFQTFFRPYFIQNYSDITSNLLEEIELTYAMCYPKLELKQNMSLNNNRELEINDRINEEVYDMLITPSISQQDINNNLMTDQAEAAEQLPKNQQKFYQETEGEFDEDTYEILSAEYSVQHDNYAHVTYNGKLLNWIITLPGDIKIFSGEIGHFIFDSRTQILIKDKRFKVVSQSNEDGITTTRFYLPPKSEGLACKCVDSNGRIFLIKSNGILNYLTTDYKSKTFKPKQRKMYNKFFVIKEKMSGYEFIHKHENNIKIKRYIDLAPENQVIDLKQNVYSHTITIDKTLSEKFILPIENPFKTINLSRKHLSDYFNTPQKWLFDLQAPHKLDYRKIKKKHKAPLAAVYRRIRNGYQQYDQLTVQIKEAFRKVDLIKSYIMQLYENKRIYFEDPVILAHLDKVYAEIYKYIGSAKNLETC